MSCYHPSTSSENEEWEWDALEGNRRWEKRGDRKLLLAYIVLGPTPSPDEFVIQSACFLNDIDSVDSFQRDIGYDKEEEATAADDSTWDHDDPSKLRFRNPNKIRDELFAFVAQKVCALRVLILYEFRWFYFGRFNSLASPSK